MILLTLAILAYIFGFICIVTIGIGAVTALILGILKLLEVLTK